MKLTKKFDKLKSMLVNEKIFSNTMIYFYDEVTMDRNFLSMDSSLMDADQIKMMQTITENALRYAIDEESGRSKNQSASLTFKGINVVETAHLIHGFFVYGKYSGVVFYFTDLQMGLCQATDLDDESHAYKHIRLTAHSLNGSVANFAFDKSNYKH
jgi:hypothetical protein